MYHPDNKNLRISDVPLFTVEVKEPSLGLEGYVCIHSMGKYGASGGMRCVEDVTKEEVQLLARAMTYKYSFFGIQQGGAKAGLKIKYDEDPERKKLLLQTAARHLEPLIKHNVWSPWTDMNFYRPDLAIFYAGIGIRFSPTGDAGSSFRTAVSAFAAIQGWMEHKQWKTEDTKIAIEGFGSVAKFLISFLKDYRIKVVGVSNRLGAVYNPKGLDIDNLLDQQKKNGSEWILERGEWENLRKEDLFNVKTDIFVPGARVHSIDEKVASGLDTSVLIPVANVPCTDEALMVLEKKGITYLPDYIVNGGGVCGHVMGHSTSLEDVQVQEFLQSLKEMIKRLLILSSKKKVSPLKLANERANENYKEIVAEAYSHEPVFLRLVHKLQEYHLLPGNIEKHERQKAIRITMNKMQNAFK